MAEQAQQPSAKDLARALVGKFDVRAELTKATTKDAVAQYLGLK